MAKSRLMLDQKKLTVYLLVIVAIFLFFDLGGRHPRVRITTVAEDQMTETDLLAQEKEDLQRRLAKLEPAAPVKIVETGRSAERKTGLPAAAIVSQGRPVPFETVFNDQNWVRPDYQPSWHSSQARALAIPDLINNAHHRLFLSSGNSILWEETARSAGVEEIAGKIQLPLYSKEPGDTIVILTFNHQVADLFVLDHQVLLLGAPTQNGVQMITVNKKDLMTADPEQSNSKNSLHQYLFQLVTPDGYEIDWGQMTLKF